VLNTDALKAIAPGRSSPPTSSTMNDCRVGRSKAPTQPVKNAITPTTGTVARSVTTRSPMTKARSIASVWVT